MVVWVMDAVVREGYYVDCCHCGRAMDDTVADKTRENFEWETYNGLYIYD
jgi:hypothetical protein